MLAIMGGERQYLPRITVVEATCTRRRRRDAIWRMDVTLDLQVRCGL